MTVADDRWGILELLHRYAFAIDTGNFEELARLLGRATLTQKIVGEGSQATGRDQLLGWLKENVILYDGKPRTMHVVTNPVIEIDPGGATARTMNYMQGLQEVRPAFPLQIIGTGLYRCEFAKDKDGWHFVDILVEPIFRGDDSHHVRAQH